MTEQTLGNYSQFLDNSLWEAVGSDYEKDCDFDELRMRIESNDFFRPFSERLLAFYNETLNTRFTNNEAATDLLRRGVNISRNTVKNWFSSKSEPKYGDKDRENMFAVAFALELDVSQTEHLFHKVFLDKAFNKRNVHEFIYLHCIYNKKPFSVAEKLINQLEGLGQPNETNEYTERTQFLNDTAMQDINESELISFISEHRHNFSLNNTAAKRHRQILLDKLCGTSKGKGLASQEFDKRRAELKDEVKNKDMSSADFLLFMIFGIDFVQKGNKNVVSIRERFSRKEIYNQFPDNQSLSLKDPASYVLRKVIILLYFYSYWVADYLEGKETGSYNGFVDELNDILFDCGFSPLYIGNPYDWLFLYCSACPDNQLDVFRGLLA